MSKVVVVIGASHAGKSSFVRNTFVRGRVGELNRDLMPYTELDDCILIGRYDTGERRRDGTDSVERKQVGNFAQQVLNLLPKGKTIVLEGMRAVSRPMMNKLMDNGVDVGIIWIHISPGGQLPKKPGIWQQAHFGASETSGHDLQKLHSGLQGQGQHRVHRHRKGLRFHNLFGK